MDRRPSAIAVARLACAVRKWSVSYGHEEALQLDTPLDPALTTVTLQHLAATSSLLRTKARQTTFQPPSSIKSLSFVASLWTRLVPRGPSLTSYLRRRISGSKAATCDALVGRAGSGHHPRAPRIDRTCRFTLNVAVRLGVGNRNLKRMTTQLSQSVLRALQNCMLRIGNLHPDC